MTIVRPGRFDLRITREFDAPPELVYDQWSNPEHVSDWFAPAGYAVTACDFEPETGRSWKVVYASASETCTEHGDFLEVHPPERLVFTLRQRGNEGATETETIVAVVFEATATGTRMHFHQSGFETAQRRDDHGVGWGECFDKLSDHLVVRAMSRRQH